MLRPQVVKSDDCDARNQGLVVEQAISAEFDREACEALRDASEFEQEHILRSALKSIMYRIQNGVR